MISTVIILAITALEFSMVNATQHGAFADQTRQNVSIQDHDVSNGDLENQAVSASSSHESGPQENQQILLANTDRSRDSWLYGGLKKLQMVCAGMGLFVGGVLFQRHADRTRFKAMQQKYAPEPSVRPAAANNNLKICKTENVMFRGGLKRLNGLSQRINAIINENPNDTRPSPVKYDLKACQSERDMLEDALDNVTFFSGAMKAGTERQRKELFENPSEFYKTSSPIFTKMIEEYEGKL